MPFLFPDTKYRDQLGGKGSALARLGALGFEIPAWFAVPEEAAWTRDELTLALGKLGGDRFAVRSSAAAEDGAAFSFAGQFSSYLDVLPADVTRHITAVRASARNEAVLAYCKEQDLPPPAKPAVLVQRMIEARASGVAFSADPVSGRRGIAVISAVAGRGDALVSGEVDGSLWHVSREGRIVLRPDENLLDDAQVMAVAALARRCASVSNRPQDIEWAIDQAGNLWLLQSRPITTIATLPDPDDTRRVWDNSNIAESYGGVTSPLTFTFARRIYEHAYREFCKLMSVPQRRIARAEDVFPYMLGLIRGRVYYNLTSWYRVLALLPGFQLNRGFMEQMMGVREPLPAEIVDRIVAENREDKFADVLALTRTCFGLFRQHRGLPEQIARFQDRLDRALGSPAVPLANQTGDELVAHYRDLERQLLKHWDAPLVNDFFAMIYYGILRSLCAKWLGDGALAASFLLDGGQIISAEPPKRIRKLAELAATHPDLAKLLADPNAPLEKKLASLVNVPALATGFDRYLADFGDRCPEELKLESPTVRDDPSGLLMAIGNLAHREAVEEIERSQPPRPKGWLRRRMFDGVVRRTQERIRWRENLRFERTRLFGRVREIFRELGKRLRSDGLLDDARDVFYLEIAEVLGVWDATCTTNGLPELARQRRAEFANYEISAAPPDRFETCGPVHRHTDFPTSTTPMAASNQMKGTAACPGRVTGRVRVVIDPRGVTLEPGEILVARQTDPGWVVLFPSAAGLLVERGSMLSHSAIVSRELRLPCIVGLPGLTQLLETGDVVTMDGAAGTVAVLERVES